MNKKNISLILIGILLLVLQFYVRVGNATIDVFSDVIGFILIVIGILPLAPRNVLFKKARLAAILGTAAAVIGQALLLRTGVTALLRCAQWLPVFLLFLQFTLLIILRKPLY